MAGGELIAHSGGEILSREDRIHWTLRRLHSLSGIVPIGAFLFFHIFENSYITRSAELWVKESEFTRNLPFQMGIEALVLWLPILYHGIYGLVITATADPNPTAYAYSRNYQYILQRITGVIAFGFIGFHVISTRGYFYIAGVDTVDPKLWHSWMMNPLMLAAYIIGVLSCVYHLTNGIFTFCITWGVAAGPRAQALVNYACIALFIVLAFVSVNILLAFRGSV